MAGTGFLAESATVAFESRNGEGRLNDAYFLHLIRQSKLMDKVPAYADVTGVRDTFPSGSFYYWGGPFAGWLQKEYGMKKYADWWYACNSGIWYDSLGQKKWRLATYAGFFEKVYGMSMATAWNKFKSSIKVPDIPADPLEEKGTGDFFRLVSGKNSDSKGFSMENLRGSQYSGFASCSTGFAWRDLTNSTVWYVDVDSQGKPGTPRRLFTKKRINSISLSQDGAYMAVCYYDINSSNYRNAVAVYDMRSKRWKEIGQAHLRDAAVVKSGDDYYLCAARTYSQKMELVCLSLSDGTLTDALECGWGDCVFSLTPLPGGRLAYIFKSGMKWSVRLCSVSGGTFADSSEYEYPSEDFRLRNLSCMYGGESDGNQLSFSWAARDTFPRAGILDLRSGEFRLDSRDVSGGVYNPVVFGNRVFYSGYFVDEYKFLYRELDSWSGGALVPASMKVEEAGSDVGSSSDGKVEAGEVTSEDGTSDEVTHSWTDKAYTRLYYPKGSIIPFSLLSQYDSGLTLTSSILLPGLTFMTNNPWNSDVLFVSAGYDISSGTGGVGATFSGGSSMAFGTDLFSYSVAPQILFDAKGYKQASVNAVFSESLGAGNISTFAFTQVLSLFEGRQHSVADEANSSAYFDLLWNSIGSGTFFEKLKYWPGISASSDPEHYFTALGQLAFVYGNKFYTGSGLFEVLGTTFSLSYTNLYTARLSKFPEGSFTQQLTPSVSLRFPKLIPVDCAEGFTYNLPLALEASLIPSDNRLLDFAAETLLFSMEIQKGFAVVPVYFRRISLTLGYEGWLVHYNDNFELFRIAEDLKALSTSDYRDCLKLALFLDATGNTDALKQFALPGISLGYKFAREIHENPWVFSVELTSRL